MRAMAGANHHRSHVYGMKALFLIEPATEAFIVLQCPAAHKGIGMLC